MIHISPDLPSDPCLDVPVRIYYYDTDAGGVVHNIAYLRHIEEARTRLAEHLGWSLLEMARNVVAPVVARTEIDYVKPARLGDLLVIHSKLDRLGKASFSISFVVERPADGSIIVRCHQTLACLQMDKGRPIRTPIEWRNQWPHLAV